MKIILGILLISLILCSECLGGKLMSQQDQDEVSNTLWDKTVGQVVQIVGDAAARGGLCVMCPKCCGWATKGGV